MSLYEDLKTNLYNSILQFFPNNTLIFAHEGGSEPIGSYVAMQILRKDAIGTKDQSTYASETDLTSKTHYELPVRFFFVGKEAGDLATLLENEIDHDSSRFIFYENNLAYLRKSEIRDMTVKRDTTWITEYHLDIVFSFSITTSKPIDIIETVTFDSQVTAS